MKTIIASIALLLATGTAAKEGLLWAYVQTITYDDRGAVFLTLDPEPTSRGFRCERVRFWATEARRKTMFEAVLTEQGGLRRAVSVFGYRMFLGHRLFAALRQSQ